MRTHWLLLLPLLLFFSCEEQFNIGPLTEGARIYSKVYNPPYETTDMVAMYVGSDSHGNSRYIYVPETTHHPARYAIVIICDDHQSQFKLMVDDSLYDAAQADEKIELTYYETVGYDKKDPKWGVKRYGPHTTEIYFIDKKIRMDRRKQVNLITKAQFDAMVSQSSNLGKY